MSTLDAYNTHQDFPVPDQTVNDEPLAYLDNAVTTQKLQQVPDTLNGYYHKMNANVRYGVHTLAGRAMVTYGASREKAR